MADTCRCAECGAVSEVPTIALCMSCGSRQLRRLRDEAGERLADQARRGADCADVLREILDTGLSARLRLRARSALQ